MRVVSARCLLQILEIWAFVQIDSRQFGRPGVLYVSETIVDRRRVGK